MVYDSTTLQALHDLTEVGKERYQEFLETEADKILWRAEHPILGFLDKIASLLFKNW